MYLLFAIINSKSIPISIMTSNNPNNLKEITTKEKSYVNSNSVIMLQGNAVMILYCMLVMSIAVLY